MSLCDFKRGRHFQGVITAADGLPRNEEDEGAILSTLQFRMVGRAVRPWTRVQFDGCPQELSPVGFPILVVLRRGGSVE